MRKSQLLAHDGVKETVRKNKKVLMSDKYIITHDRHRFFFTITMHNVKKKVKKRIYFKSYFVRNQTCATYLAWRNCRSSKPLSHPVMLEVYAWFLDHNSRRFLPNSTSNKIVLGRPYPQEFSGRL